MKQEGILANWALGTLTPKDLEDATDNLIKKATEQYDKVGQLKPEELNIENCVQVKINHKISQFSFKNLNIIDYSNDEIEIDFYLRLFSTLNVFL